jgi:hypothetical protein
MFEDAFKVFIDPPRELQHLPGIAPSLLEVRRNQLAGFTVSLEKDRLRDTPA